MTAAYKRPVVAALFVIAVLIASVAGGAGERRPGLQTYKTSPRTEAGDWYGTWVYKSRDQRVVLWLRADASGRPEYRLQYQSLGTPEAFTTDWTGRSEYAVTGTDALFHLAAKERGEHSIRGTLDWDLQFERSGRRRTAEFEMFRGGDGRHLVLHFHKQSLVIRKGDKEATDNSPGAWTFIKNSRRLVLWEEIF